MLRGCISAHGTGEGQPTLTLGYVRSQTEGELGLEVPVVVPWHTFLRKTQWSIEA